MYQFYVYVLSIYTSYLCMYWFDVLVVSTNFWGATGAPILFSEIMLTYGFLCVVLYIYIYIYVYICQKMADVRLAFVF